MSPLPRVLSYPPVHDYVDRLRGVTATLVHPDQPWPRLPGLYDPTWVHRHADDWDVVHLHFTWEQYPVETVSSVLAAHRSAGTPVVWTAHDLRNPHTREPGRDEPYLRLLAERADEVTTLTAGAATAVKERFGRRATAIPHGPLVTPSDAARLRSLGRSEDARLRVLLLAKSLRANLDWRTPMAVAARLAEQGAPIVLQVHLHDGAPEGREVIEYGRRRGVEVVVGDRIPTGELWRRIRRADVLLLPYRWGTHSGLLELATDLGTAVVATDVGYLAEQAPCSVVRTRGGQLDAAHLADVLAALAREDRLPAPVPLAQRRAALGTFHEGHAALYTRVRQGRGTAVAR